MKTYDALLGSVRRELNHIYTEPPFESPNGSDMGWFCREHALHVAILAQMLGERSALCCGDIIVRIPGRTTFYTVGADADHAWCRVDERVPVDASVTLRYLDPETRDVKLVYPGKEDDLSGFQLEYYDNLPNEEFAQELECDRLLIAYNQKEVFDFDLGDVLADPFIFLHRPPPGMPTLLDSFGPDIFFQITAHLYKLACGRSRPFFTYRDQRSSIRAIVKHNANARALVFDALS